jgi:hypothetical protein
MDELVVWRIEVVDVMLAVDVLIINSVEVVLEARLLLWLARGLIHNNRLQKPPSVLLVGAALGVDNAEHVWPAAVWIASDDPESRGTLVTSYTLVRNCGALLEVRV